MKTSSIAVETSRSTTQMHSIVRQTNKRSSFLLNIYLNFFDKCPENYLRPIVKRHRFCMHCVPFIFNLMENNHHNLIMKVRVPIFCVPFIDSCLSELIENKTKHRILHSYWPLNRGKNNRRTLIGTAKRWPRPLDRGGHLGFY